MAARVEDGVELGRVNLRQTDSGRQRGLGGIVGLESTGRVGLHLWQRARRIDRGLSALR